MGNGPMTPTAMCFVGWKNPVSIFPDPASSTSMSTSTRGRRRAGAIAVLRGRFADAEVIEPEGDYRGYVQFHVEAPVTYELVIRMQREVMELMRPYGGYCESWGVMQE
jgi:hypothetical protein